MKSIRKLFSTVLILSCFFLIGPGLQEVVLAGIIQPPQTGVDWPNPRFTVSEEPVTTYGSDMTFKTQISGHGDCDGDEKTDISVWRPSDGRWYTIRSSDGGVTATQGGTGSFNEVPVPGDYDGDEKSGIAVWRPRDGMWYIIRSSEGGVTATPSGTGDLNDIPIPENTLIY